MKILLYNIFEGAQDSLKFEKLIDFVNLNSFDLVVFLEANNWEENNFKLFGEKTDFFSSKLFLTNTGFHYAIFSKFEIENIFEFKENFHHGLLKFKVSGINFFVSHLNPFGEDFRLNEITFILSKMDLESNTILIGDLNSLSVRDNYDEKDLLKIFNKINLKKFGNNKIRFDVQNKILDFGLVDSIKMFSDEFEYSVPTKVNVDKAHITKLRLDYAYLTPCLAKKLIYSKVIRNELTDEISDHYPLVLELDLN